MSEALVVGWCVAVGLSLTVLPPSERLPLLATLLVGVTFLLVGLLSRGWVLASLLVTAGLTSGILLAALSRPFAPRWVPRLAWAALVLGAFALGLEWLW